MLADEAGKRSFFEVCSCGRKTHRGGRGRDGGVHQAQQACKAWKLDVRSLASRQNEAAPVAPVAFEKSVSASSGRTAPGPVSCAPAQKHHVMLIGWCVSS